MTDPEDVLDPILDQAHRILKEMGKTKDLTTRKEQSEVLKNLCDSAGVFLNLISDAMMAQQLDGLDDDLDFLNAMQEQDDDPTDPPIKLF